MEDPKPEEGDEMLEQQVPRAPDTQGGSHASPSPHVPTAGIVCTTFFRRVKEAAKEITLEPMLFLKMAAEGNFGVIADTLELDRICRVNLNYSAADCDAKVQEDNLTHVQVAVQRYQNIFNYNQSLMDSLIPLVVVLFAGSLSDRHGRKLPMLAVLAGFVGLGVVYMLMALYPTWPVQVLYAANLAVDLPGSWVVFNMAVYSYVADITTPETRTKRLATLDAVWYLGGPLGRVIGGWLYKVFGFVVVFKLSVGLWLLCFLYTLLVVPESIHECAVEAQDEQEIRDARWGPLRHVVALCRTAFKSRPARGRWFLLFLVLLKMGVFLVQGHQMYLWAQRVMKWEAAEFSTWSSVDSVVHQVGMVAWVWVAARAHLHDSLVAVGGAISIGLWSVVLACITGPQMWWLVAVGSVLGMLEPTMEPALRTMLTTIVGEEEAGRVLSLVGLVEAFWLIVDRTLYTFLYNTFVLVFPQINFVVQASLCVPLVVALLVLRHGLARREAHIFAPERAHTPQHLPDAATGHI